MGRIVGTNAFKWLFLRCHVVLVLIVCVVVVCAFVVVVVLSCCVVVFPLVFCCVLFRFNMFLVFI